MCNKTYNDATIDNVFNHDKWGSKNDNEITILEQNIINLYKNHKRIVICKSGHVLTHENVLNFTNQIFFNKRIFEIDEDTNDYVFLEKYGFVLATDEIIDLQHKLIDLQNAINEKIKQNENFLEKSKMFSIMLSKLQESPINKLNAMHSALQNDNLEEYIMQEYNNGLKDGIFDDILNNIFPDLINQISPIEYQPIVPGTIKFLTNVMNIMKENGTLDKITKEMIPGLAELYETNPTLLDNKFNID